MIYLLTLGWPWFAGACALGAGVGFLATSREKDAAAAPGWVFVALALALCAGFAVSAAGLLDGRAALTFDIALVAALAYSAGLPLGRGLKLLRGEAPVDAKRTTAPQRPIIAAAPQARIEPAPAPAALVVENESAAVEASREAAQALKEAAAQMRGQATPLKAAQSGMQPPALAAPRNDAPDDLTKIKGLGPKSVAKLHALGIFHYDQIAGWSRDHAKWVDAAIGGAGRVERSNWVAQARALSQPTPLVAEDAA